MNRYESIIIFDDRLTEKEYNSCIDTLRDHLISTTPTHLRKTEKLGKKKLAYVIKRGGEHKCSEGWYVVFHFEAHPDFITEWERILRIDDQVIKFLTIRVEDSDDEEDSAEDCADSAEECEQDVKMQQPDALDVMLGFAQYNKKGV